MKSTRNKAHYEATAQSGSPTLLRTNDWSHYAILATNFEQITGPISCHNLSVLDCGAGTGELLAYLRHVRGTAPLHYDGIDVSEFAVKQAEAQFPHHHFHIQDLLEYTPKIAPDWVVMSGVMTIIEQDHEAHVRQMIAKAYQVARLGVIFNMLSDQLLEENEFYQLDNSRYYANESEIAQYCGELAPRLIRQSSLDRTSFTIHMLKSKAVPLNTDYSHLTQVTRLIQHHDAPHQTRPFHTKRDAAWERLRLDKSAAALAHYTEVLKEALNGQIPTLTSQYMDAQMPDKILVSELLITVLDNAMPLIVTPEFDVAVSLLPCHTLRLFFLAHSHILTRESARVCPEIEPVLQAYPRFQRAASLHDFCLRHAKSKRPNTGDSN
ncbi:MAG: class I SAM-dependent methyltransferase [bacterium]|nr:class I SAM-dependent methyltransferase [bacterium]